MTSATLEIQSPITLSNHFGGTAIISWRHVRKSCTAINESRRHERKRVTSIRNGVRTVWQSFIIHKNTRTIDTSNRLLISVRFDVISLPNFITLPRYYLALFASWTQSNPFRFVPKRTTTLRYTYIRATKVTECFLTRIEWTIFLC